MRRRFIPLLEGLEKKLPLDGDIPPLDPGLPPEPPVDPMAPTVPSPNEFTVAVPVLPVSAFDSNEMTGGSSGEQMIYPLNQWYGPGGP